VIPAEHLAEYNPEFRNVNLRYGLGDLIDDAKNFFESLWEKVKRVVAKIRAIIDAANDIGKALKDLLAAVLSLIANVRDAFTLNFLKSAPDAVVKKHLVAIHEVRNMARGTPLVDRLAAAFAKSVQNNPDATIALALAILE